MGRLNDGVDRTLSRVHVERVLGPSPRVVRRSSWRQQPTASLPRASNSRQRADPERRCVSEDRGDAEAGPHF